MKFFDRPLHIPLIEALPGHLFPNTNAQLKLGEVAVTEPTEPVFPHGLTRKDPVEHGWNMAPAEPEGAQILKFPMAEVVELHVPDNIQLGQE
jgi:hypothetical protein